MLKDILSLSRQMNKPNNRPKDTNYAGNALGAVTLGVSTLGGTRGKGHTTGGTFDYLSTAENTIECYYQKLDDLRYYESHALTEKIIGLFRDYISQLWKDGSKIVDIPGEDPELVDQLNNELEFMEVLEVLTKDLNSVIFHGSVSYEISGVDAKDPNYLPKEHRVIDNIDHASVRNIDYTKDKPKDRKYSFDPIRLSKAEVSVNSEDDKYYEKIRDTNYAETVKEKAARLVESTSPSVQKLVNSTSPSSKRGIEEAKEYISNDSKGKLNSIRSKGTESDTEHKLHNIKSKVPYEGKLKLNKLKHPHHTIVEYDRYQGRRYLVKANSKYHIPTNKHTIFYYGNDSMKIAESDDVKRRDKSKGKSNVTNLIGHQESTDLKKKEYESLGINPNDPKKIPTKYELQKRELSASVPLFYHHLPKVRELYLKDLVVSILGIKDVIQPDILAMNFEGGMDIDQAQNMCTDLEDLLNKNSDYSVFNSSTLDYNDLVKLLVDTVRVLPDIEGKLQSLNPVRTTSLQEKIQQVRMEAKELERDVVSSLGVPMDLFEGNSSKWEVIKRSERLQSRVTYYINTLKASIRRLAESVFFHLNGRELKSTDFRVTLFNESDMDIAAKTNRLQAINELNQTMIQVIVGAERELQESQLVNKSAYYKLLKSNLKEIYPEVGDLLVDIDELLDPNKKMDVDNDEEEEEQYR